MKTEEARRRLEEWNRKVNDARLTRDVYEEEYQRIRRERSHWYQSLPLDVFLELEGLPTEGRGGDKP